MDTNPTTPLNPDQVDSVIRELLDGCTTKFWDIHTHLFPPQAGDLVRFGIDELLNYHYVYRQVLGFRRDITPQQFWKLEPEKRADLCWETCFARGAADRFGVLPVSEGLRAIATIFTGLGLDPAAPDLRESRAFFSGVDSVEYHNRILEMAGVTSVIGTNNPFDPVELAFYESGKTWHSAFGAALRLDDLVLNPADALTFMRDRFGCDVSESLSAGEIETAISFCSDWMTGKYMPAVHYAGISFPPDFPWLDSDDPRMRVLESIVIPACVRAGISLFLMPEPVRQLEPVMKNAGDYLGKMDSVAFARFCQRHPEVDLWVSPLNFSSQYEMSALTCVLPHVKPWSTWWYNHQPSLTRDLCNLRIEMHGENCWLFNSDARVLEQLYSKWVHFRQEFTAVASTQLKRVAAAGYPLTRASILRWMETLFDPRKINREKWRGALLSKDSVTV